MMDFCDGFCDCDGLFTFFSNMDDDSEEHGDPIVDKMEANNGVHVTVEYNGDVERKPAPESEIGEVKNGVENDPEPAAVITPRSPRITHQSPDSTRVSSSSPVRPTLPLGMPHQGKSRQSGVESTVVSSEPTERDSKCNLIHFFMPRFLEYLKLYILLFTFYLDSIIICGLVYFQNRTRPLYHIPCSQLPSLFLGISKYIWNGEKSLCCTK